MQDAEKQFAKTRSEADKLKLETAQADYDNMVRNLKSVTKAAGDTEKAISKIEDTATGSSISLKVAATLTNEVLFSVNPASHSAYSRRVFSALSCLFSLYSFPTVQPHRPTVQRLAVKTNLLYDAILMPSLEVDMNQKTFGINGQTDGVINQRKRNKGKQRSQSQ